MPKIEAAVVIRMPAGLPMILSSLGDTRLVHHLLLLAIADADRRCQHSDALAAAGARKQAVVLRELLTSIEADHCEPLMQRTER